MKNFRDGGGKFHRLGVVLAVGYGGGRREMMFRVGKVSPFN
jgi:hypothetical protein